MTMAANARSGSDAASRKPASAISMLRLNTIPPNEEDIRIPMAIRNRRRGKETCSAVWALDCQTLIRVIVYPCVHPYPHLSRFPRDNAHGGLQTGIPLELRRFSTLRKHCYPSLCQAMKSHREKKS